MKIRSALVLSLIVFFSGGVYELINNIPKKIDSSNLKEAEVSVNKAEEAYNSLPDKSKQVMPYNMYNIIKTSKEEIKKLKDSTGNSTNSELNTVTINNDSVSSSNNQNIADSTDGSVNKPNIEDNSNSFVNDSNNSNIEDNPNNSINDSNKPNIENDTNDSISAEKVEHIINLIDNVDSSITLEDEKSLDNIELNLDNIQKQYDLLSDDEKKSVTNYENLKSAKANLVAIKKQINLVYEAILEIPEEITYDNLNVAEEAVTKAEKAYNALKEEHKKGVQPTEYSIIQRSREQIERIKDAISAEKVESVINLIDNVDSSITLEDEKSLDNIELNLDNIQKQYDLLSDDEKKSVTNYENLKSAKANLVAIKKQINLVYEAILEIPEEITYDNLNVAEEAVTKAEKAYNALKEEHKKGVQPTEYSIIQRSREQIDRIKDAVNDVNQKPVINQKQVENVISLINEIDSCITFENDKEFENIEKELNNIKKEYRLLSVEEQNLVTNYEKLEAAQDEVTGIRNRLNELYNLIYLIPEDINLSNLEEAEIRVHAAEQAYHNLSDKDKKAVISFELNIITSSRDVINRLRDYVVNSGSEKVIAIEKKIEELQDLIDENIEAYRNPNKYDELKQIDNKIQDIFNDWNNLSSSEKNVVTNRSKLDDSYEKVRYVKAKIIEQEISKIDLKKVTENDRTKLEELQESYEKLDRVGQLLVGNYSNLKMAINQLDFNE